MKAVNHEVVGYKLIGDAFELCNGQGYGVAGQLQPGGLPDISRGLSASDTPGPPSKTNCTLEGCQNCTPIEWHILRSQISGTSLNRFRFRSPIGALSSPNL